MKAKSFWTVVLTLSFIGVVSCNQGPIFYTISTETPPLKARVSGSPTNMVVFNRVVPNPDDPAETKELPVLCVASGSLYWYARKNYGEGDAAWKPKEYSRKQDGKTIPLIPQPGGKIIALAVAGDYLYALCLTGHNVNTELKRIKNVAEQWEPVTPEAGGYPLIQSIHADPDSEPGSPGRLFAGARRNDSTKEVYAVFYVDDFSGSPVLKILKSDTAVLSGAAYRKGNHYLSTNGGGVFRVTETDLADGTFTELTPLPEEGSGTTNNSRHFMGMIKLKDADETIIAVERNGGAFYEIKSDSFEQRKYPSNGEAIATGRYATGALALWEGSDPSDPDITRKLLVAGIQGGLYNNTTTSYTYGYVEFDLNDDGSLNEDSFRREQGSLKSVSDNNRYTASIGKHSINHLFQAPEKIEPKRTFFASTQIAGLWSYRNREKDGGWQWNAEN